MWVIKYVRCSNDWYDWLASKGLFGKEPFEKHSIRLLESFRIRPGIRGETRKRVVLLALQPKGFKLISSEIMVIEEGFKYHSILERSGMIPYHPHLMIRELSRELS